jgi:hypothetical protein
MVKLLTSQLSFEGSPSKLYLESSPSFRPLSDQLHMTVKFFSVKRQNFDALI